MIFQPTQKDHEKLNRFGLPARPRDVWWAIYDGIAAAGVGIVHVAGLFHKKLGAAVCGRAGGVTRWQIQLLDGRPSVLIHAASRGEFEAVCPLVDRLLKRGDCRVAVSYSSPSVEKTVQNYPGLWASGYLPFDRLGEQLRFLTRIEPSVILIAKHDIWPNMIRAAAMLRIPFILINANFHSRTKRRLPFVSRFNRQFLSLVSEIWTISEEDAARIKPLVAQSTPLKVVGDTRYDRTMQRAEEARGKHAGLKTALGTGPVIVAGSTWPPEEKIIFPAFSSLKKTSLSAKLVIAPHEPEEESLSRCRKAAVEQGLTMMLYSQWKGDPVTEDIITIDCLGILADIYAVGWATIVGGGFGVGVHSVLEPAAYNLPVAFGPNCHVSREAGLLLKCGGGSILASAEALCSQWSGWLDDPACYAQAANSAGNVVASHAGATSRVLELLEPYLRRQ